MTTETMRPARKKAAADAPAPRVTDEAVSAKTGRSWAEWFAALDRVGAKGRTHEEIVALVSQRFGVGAWWRQMITVEYERARGQRAVNQVATGFTATISRTFDATVAELAAQFESPRTLVSWLRIKDVIHTSGTPGKVLRFDWPDGSRVEARFTGKGPARSSVAIEQSRLANAAGVATAKATWSDALERLRGRLAE